MKKIILMMFVGLLLQSGQGLCMDDRVRKLDGSIEWDLYDIISQSSQQAELARLLSDPRNTSIEGDLASVLTGNEPDLRLCKLGDREALTEHLRHNPLNQNLLKKIARLGCNRLAIMDILLNHGANPDSVEFDEIMQLMRNDDSRDLGVQKIVLLTRMGMDPLKEKKTSMCGADGDLYVRATGSYNLFKHLYMRVGRIKNRELERRIMDARDQYLAEQRANLDPSIIEKWEAYKRDHRDDLNDDIARKIAHNLRLPDLTSVRWQLDFVDKN